MNVYDSANTLAKAIKESHEYKKLIASKETLVADANAATMVADFLKKQAEMQLEAMSGKPVDSAKQDALQKLYELISMNEKGRDYVQSYMRFQLMMDDVYKMVGEVVKPAVSGLNDAEK